MHYIKSDFYIVTEDIYFKYMRLFRTFYSSILSSFKNWW